MAKFRAANAAAPPVSEMARASASRRTAVFGAVVTRAVSDRSKMGASSYRTAGAPGAETSLLRPFSWARPSVAPRGDAIRTGEGAPWSRYRICWRATAPAMALRRLAGSHSARQCAFVIPIEEMPDDNVDFARLDVTFEQLHPDTAESCAVPTPEILEYLAMEAPGGDRLRDTDLTFLRTARVAEVRYWIWRFHEPDGGAPAYLTVAVDQRGASSVGYETDPLRSYTRAVHAGGLSPSVLVLSRSRRDLLPPPACHAMEP